MRLSVFAVLAFVASGCTVHVVEQPATPLLVAAPAAPLVYEARPSRPHRVARPQRVAYVPPARPVAAAPVAATPVVATPVVATPVVATPVAAAPPRKRPSAVKPTRPARPLVRPFRILPPEPRDAHSTDPLPARERPPRKARRPEAIAKRSSAGVAKPQ